MQTRIVFPAEGVTAEVQHSADNKQVIINPLFRTPTDTPTVAYIDSLVTENGATKPLYQYLLVQSGKDAKLRLISCQRRAQPRFYLSRKPSGDGKPGAK